MDVIIFASFSAYYTKKQVSLTPLLSLLNLLFFNFLPLLLFKKKERKGKERKGKERKGKERDFLL